jgi:hypothetical protein
MRKIVVLVHPLLRCDMTWGGLVVYHGTWEEKQRMAPNTRTSRCDIYMYMYIPSPATPCSYRAAVWASRTQPRWKIALDVGCCRERPRCSPPAPWWSASLALTQRPWRSAPFLGIATAAFELGQEPKVASISLFTQTAPARLLLVPPPYLERRSSRTATAASASARSADLAGHSSNRARVAPRVAQA